MLHLQTSSLILSSFLQHGRNCTKTCIILWEFWVILNIGFVGREKTIMYAGVKRDHNGNARDKSNADAPRNRFHDMFEGFRDELDQHHDRRERIVKVSRDVTAQSKKM